MVFWGHLSNELGREPSVHQDMAAMYLSHRRDSGSDRKAEDAKGCIKVILKVLGRVSRIIKWSILGKDHNSKFLREKNALDTTNV